MKNPIQNTPKDFTILQLAIAARPIDDDDYGSDRQIKAETLWVETAYLRMSEADQDRWNHYALKATPEEAISFGLRLLITKEEIDELVNDAIDAAALSIQDRLGVDDGGYAGVFFSGDNEVSEGLAQYIKGEIGIPAADWERAL